MLSVGDKVRIVFNSTFNNSFGKIGTIVEMREPNRFFIVQYDNSEESGFWEYPSSLECIENEFQAACKILGTDYFYG